MTKKVTTKYLIPALLLWVQYSIADNKSVESIIEDILGSYSSLASYHDKGQMKIRITNLDGATSENYIEFQTSYNGETDFSFIWVELPTELEKKLILPPGMKGMDRSKPRINKIWRDKSGIYTQLDGHEPDEYNSIRVALFAHLGVSSGLTWIVPRFLWPEIPCPPLLGAIKSEMLDERGDFIVIKLEFKSGDTAVLHINKSNFLLEKYEKYSTSRLYRKRHIVIEYEYIEKD